MRCLFVDKRRHCFERRDARAALFQAARRFPAHSSTAAMLRCRAFEVAHDLPLRDQGREAVLGCAQGPGSEFARRDQQRGPRSPLDRSERKRVAYAELYEGSVRSRAPTGRPALFPDLSGQCQPWPTEQTQRRIESQVFRNPATGIDSAAGGDPMSNYLAQK